MTDKGTFFFITKKENQNFRLIRNKTFSIFAVKYIRNTKGEIERTIY